MKKKLQLKIPSLFLLGLCLLISLLSCSPIKPSTEVSNPFKTEGIPAIKHENLPVYGAPFIPETEQTVGFITPEQYKETTALMIFKRDFTAYAK
jgi:hypothetical protein